MMAVQNITTQRLTIRRVAAGDHTAIRAIWAAVKETGYAQYDRPNDLDECAVAVRIRKWASFSESEEHMFFAVCLQEAVIGYIALNRRDGGYELGYCFHPAYHGMGYAKESIGAVLNTVGSMGVHQIEAGTALANTPSVRLLKALGFVMTGTEEVSFFRDAFGNDIFFSGGLFELTLQKEFPNAQYQ